MTPPAFHPNAFAARRLLQGKNPNLFLPSGEFAKKNWFKDIPEGQQHFVPFNGGLGETQRDWLRNQLREAWSEKQYVVIFSHVPVHSARPSRTLLWDREEVEGILGEEVVREEVPEKAKPSKEAVPNEFAGRGSAGEEQKMEPLPKLGDHVLAFVAGHRHTWSECTDALGIKHVVLPSPMLAEPVEEGGECCAILSLGVEKVGHVASSQGGVVEAPVAERGHVVSSQGGVAEAAVAEREPLSEEAFANIEGHGATHPSLEIRRRVAFD